MSVCVKSQRQVELCHDGRKQVLNFHSNEREGVVKWRGTFQVMCLSSGGIVMKIVISRQRLVGRDLVYEGQGSKRKG